jgi:hypothetical protein
MNTAGIHAGRRASAVTLGFFLYLLFPLTCGALEGLSLSGRAGSLWVEQDGAVIYWLSGVSYRPARRFHLEVELGGLFSDLPWAETRTDAPLLFFTGGLDLNRLGFHFSGAYFSHKRFDAELGEVQLYNEGGGGGFLNVSLPVYLGALVVTPSFLSGGGFWSGGSLYWFFGKPVIPSLYGYGVVAEYAGGHTLEFRGLTLEPEIRSNEGESLFAVRLDIFSGSYTVKLGSPALKSETGRRRFEGTFGWLYAGAQAEGALTASNQHYILFPFNFFSVNGSTDAHIGYGLVRFLFQRSIFQFDITLGAANVFWGKAAANYHYKMKKLFGGSEAQEDLNPVKLDNIGAVFLLLDAGMVFRAGLPQKQSTLSFGLQKALAIPWGYERLTPSSGADSGDRTPAAALDDGLWRTVLLSGLSAYLKLSW